MSSHKLFLTRAIKSAASIARRSVNFPAAIPAEAINIVAYHRVVRDIAKAEREAIPGLSISGESFQRHCEILGESFEIVTLEEAARILGGAGAARKPLAVITFDDGYLDFYEVAFPILREFGFPATNFLPTNLIGSDKLLAHDRIFWLLKTAAEKQISIRPALEFAGIGYAESLAAINDTKKVCDMLVHLPNAAREKIISALGETLGENFVAYPREYDLLNWKQIEEMQNAGIEFGFHTAHHTVLPLESDKVFETEIVAGKRELERRLNRKVVSIAYPNGAYNERVKRAVAEAGFEIAVTTERKINLPDQADALALGRISFCEESTRGIKGVFSPAVAKLRLGV